MFIFYGEVLAHWHTVMILLFLLIWSLLSGLAAAADYSGLNVTFFYITLDPNSTITKFQSVQVVPPPSDALIIPGNVQAFWPALQNNENIIQTAVANQGDILEWFYIGLEYCCSPGDWQADKAQRVYPEDRINTQYELTNASTGVYTVSWIIKRGQNGIQAGAMDFSAESAFNPQEHQTPGGQGPFTKALFSIETQKGGTWDFGPVQWDQITIQASTTSSDWCHSPKNNTDFDYYLDAPTISISGTQVTCKFSSLVIGDKKPPTLPSSPTTASYIDAGPTTRSNVVPLIDNPTPLYHLHQLLATPQTQDCGSSPNSTLSNGLPDPSYSSKVASESNCNSHNSAQISSYSSVLNEQLESVYGTITTTAVDRDSALTTVSTYDYIAEASSGESPPPLGGLASVVVNHTKGDRDTIGISALWLVCWFIAMSLLVFVCAVGFFMFEKRRRR